MKVAIPGARGLIGRRLVRLLLDRGHTPVALTRNAKRLLEAPYSIEWRTWDPDNPETGNMAFQNIDAIVNLSGEPVGSGWWTKKKMKRIRDSRVFGNQRIVDVLSHVSRGPRVYIAGSAVGYYGSRGDEILTESSEKGEGFLAEVSRDLEAQAAKASHFGLRVVLLRTGVVLSGTGGALAKMHQVFKWGLGGKIGDGRQWLPWIHESDIAEIILYCLERHEIEGPVNGTAPNPVPNSEFTQALGAVLGKATPFPIPEVFLKISLGRMAEILTASQRVVPEKLLNSDFQFQYPDLGRGLNDCLKTHGNVIR
ncbi:MAG: TIGR01777 family oxidoreductase [Candidatus Eisenbacteria bacterium]|uniref:TIGR01777 family oxidoreductase n=1 Tax=Eiseniibacteriota bacterium TaxID=2212470 RepID=A0A948RWP1_UNCEI|nr:TIGR01777 family oxidoreductase [Candidatus Eisenbacteria bacterium]MBU1950854.1 TIGR01777 family oxidoreductase [Candidatus Eisenbacteria bacterium]MBU2692420.1 TIGR01777 family oxidoreductase [Candidatus Eisenbacteria bacterium]